MAILWLDSFDVFDASHLAQRYERSSNAGQMQIGVGRTGNGLATTTAGISELVKSVPHCGGLTVGFAYKPDALSNQELFQLWNVNSGSYQCSLRLNSTGTLSLLAVAGLPVATSRAVLTANAWNYIEAAIVVDSATGSIHFRINGQDDAVSGGLNTRSTLDIGVDQAILRGSTPANGIVDDYYLADQFLGPIKILCLAPSGVGAHSDWGAFQGGTPATGAHYTYVDDGNAQDGDATTVISTGAATYETYRFPSVSGGISDFTVLAVAVSFVGRSMTSSGALYTVPIAPVVRAGGQDYDGTTRSVSGGYAHYTQIYETDPATSAAWTPSQVDAAEFGVKRVS
jgi:hypothetical protein